jgi:hypothetical protein
VTEVFADRCATGTADHRRPGAGRSLSNRSADAVGPPVFIGLAYRFMHVVNQMTVGQNPATPAEAGAKAEAGPGLRREVEEGGAVLNLLRTPKYQYNNRI